MEIRHLKLIKAVSHVGSLTRASEVLFVSQSALSHRLKEVEEEFGFSIFNRTSRGLKLTPRGAIVLEYANSILDLLDELNKRLEDKKKVIRFSIQAYTTYFWLSNILIELKEKYNTDIEVITENTTNPHDMILQGKLDFSLMVYKSEDVRFRSEVLFEDTLVVLMSEYNELANCPWMEPEDFNYQTLITHSNPFERNLILEKANPNMVINPRNTKEVRNTLTIIEFVEENLGVAILSMWAVEGYLANRRIVTKNLGVNGTKRHWYLSYLRNKKLENYESKFISLMKSRLST